MDTHRIAELLRATIDPNKQQQAEEQLTQVHKIIGFAPSLLQVVMSADVDMPVRQAGVIYLKNMVTQNWQEHEVEAGQALAFHIHEQDQAMIRDAIVDAVVLAPELVRVKLGVCVNHIVRHDFPGRWTQIVDKISIYLQSPDAAGYMGALLCLYQLVKNFEYKKVEERTLLTEAMNLLLPQVQQLLVRLLSDLSEQSVLLQKQILKIFYALIKYSLPMTLLTKPIFTRWMELTRVIANRPVPEHTLTVNEEDKPELPWWKQDGGLHMMGSLADILLKRSLYKNQIEQLLATLVFPAFSSLHGHVRARGYWVLQHFSNIKFDDESILAEAINFTQRALLTDAELPVKMEAAVALQMLLSRQEGLIVWKYINSSVLPIAFDQFYNIFEVQNSQTYHVIQNFLEHDTNYFLDKTTKNLKINLTCHIELNIRPITFALLKLIHERDNEVDLTNMQFLIATYSQQQLMPVAVKICQHLVATFVQAIPVKENSNKRRELVKTIRVVIAAMEDYEEVLAHLEPVVVQLIGFIFTHSTMECYKEAFSIVSVLTSMKISPDLWRVLTMIFKVFEKDAFDYFTDMMPALLNYVTVGTTELTSNSRCVVLLDLFNMCKKVLNRDSGADAECHASKLLEVIVLKCKGKVHYYIPSLELGKLLEAQPKYDEIYVLCAWISIFYGIVAIGLIFITFI